MKWRIGDVTITKVVEIEMASKATWILPDLTAENLATVPWARPHFATDDGRVVMSIHALVVESQGQRIVVDTCVGNDKNLIGPWNQRQGTFLADLAAAGFSADSIDTVLCTHLHFDHVGWNTMKVDGRWVPTFPSARYLFARTEWEHWKGREDRGYASTFDDAVAPVVDAGLAELVETTHRVTDEVWLEPTPGHTPGHVSVRISSRGEDAFITGDMTHHPVLWAEPDWGMDADSDSKEAASSRRRVIAANADRPVLVIGTHYAPPTAGYIVTLRGGTRFAAHRG